MNVQLMTIPHVQIANNFQKPSRWVINLCSDTRARAMMKPRDTKLYLNGKKKKNDGDVIPKLNERMSFLVIKSAHDLLIIFLSSAGSSLGG